MLFRTKGFVSLLFCVHLSNHIIIVSKLIFWLFRVKSHNISISHLHIIWFRFQIHVLKGLIRISFASIYQINSNKIKLYIMGFGHEFALNIKFQTIWKSFGLGSFFLGLKGFVTFIN
jgi:hypothetical protein